MYECSEGEKRLGDDAIYSHWPMAY